MGLSNKEKKRIVAKALHGQRYPLPLCFESKGMLQVADAFKVTKTEHFSKNRVVRNPERSLFISVGDVDDVHGVKLRRGAQ